MSTETSPLNRPRSKKITGGRVRCLVYLTKEEVQEIDKIAAEVGMSRSSIISQNYYLGKKHTSTNEDPNP